MEESNSLTEAHKHFIFLQSFFFLSFGDRDHDFVTHTFSSENFKLINDSSITFTVPVDDVVPGDYQKFSLLFSFLRYSVKVPQYLRLSGTASVLNSSASGFSELQLEHFPQSLENNDRNIVIFKIESIQTNISAPLPGLATASSPSIPYEKKPYAQKTNTTPQNNAPKRKMGADSCFVYGAVAGVALILIFYQLSQSTKAKSL